MAAPAPASMSRVRAIWPAIRVLWILRPDTLPVALRELDCIIRLTWGRDSCQAGERPNRIPVATATAMENKRTGRLIWIAASCGKENSGRFATITETVL